MNSPSHRCSSTVLRQQLTVLSRCRGRHCPHSELHLLGNIKTEQVPPLFRFLSARPFSLPHCYPWLSPLHLPNHRISISPHNGLSLEPLKLDPQ